MNMGQRGLVVVCLVVAAQAPAAADLFTLEKFRAYADFRVRGEADWDSQDASAVERDDRTRLRVRARAGFVFDPDEHIRVEVRIRGGQEASQQSPHITVIDFSGNDTGESSFDFDRWYLRGKVGGFETWAGRNDLPFWKQDELLFDDDVTMAGVSARWAGDLGPGKLSVAGGYVAPPVGMTLYPGSLAGAQVAYQPQVGGVQLAFAAGTYVFEADPTDPDGAGWLQGNAARDFSIASGSVQARWPVADRPLVLGADVMTNTEDYDPNSADPVTAANADETDGYVFLATYGDLDAGKHWLAGYYYAHIETFAVHNSYAQDDCATQTRASDMKGHELRFGWAFTAQMNLLARLYAAEAITSVEDGKRFRLDFNYRF
jgi:hypothetical protein